MSFSDANFIIFNTMKTALNLFLHVLLLTAMAFLQQGCATILGGRTNSFVFSGSYPSGAQILLNDSLVGTPPGKVVLPPHRIQHGSVLEIRAEGYINEEYLILRKVHPVYTAVDVFTGIIPLIVDAGTGNLYRPSPRKFETVMRKEDTP